MRRFRTVLLLSGALILLASALPALAGGSNIPGGDQVPGASPNVLSPAGTGPTMLYCPSNADDPTYRATLASATGGTVDYYDASAGTPPLALLQAYDCVYTWANSNYADATLMGDRLADYVDSGGKVILGAFCTFTGGASLAGRIMTADYCPVASPTGMNHYADSPYAGDGTTRIHYGITSYNSGYRDVLVPQGLGIVDGHYADGEIAHAYRPDGRVVYSNGLGETGSGNPAEWAAVLANICKWQQPGGVMYGCDNAANLFTVNIRTGAGFGVGVLPTSGGAGASEIEYSAPLGVGYVQGRDGSFGMQAFLPADGSAAGPFVSNGKSWGAMEDLNGLLVAAGIPGPCAPCSIAVLDPGTGAVTQGPYNLGVGPMAGMAWDDVNGIMYYVTGGGGGCGFTPGVYYSTFISNLATYVADLPMNPGSAEFGPDGNLYVGGASSDGGNLYRVNPTTGASVLVGPTGYGSVTGLTLVSGPLAVAVNPFVRDHSTLGLAPPSPNPSRTGSSVRIAFSLPSPGPASVALFDLAGRRVWSQDAGELEAGEHTVVWDGRNLAGEPARSGIYFIRVSAGGAIRTGRLLRL